MNELLDEERELFKLIEEAKARGDLDLVKQLTHDLINVQVEIDAQKGIHHEFSKSR